MSDIEDGSEPPGEEEDLIVKFDRWDRDLTRHWSEWRTEAVVWFGMYAGDQHTREEKQQLEEALRVPVTINRIGPMVDAVQGAEITNRQEVRFFPREAGDSGVNELLTAAAEWARQECDAADEESDAFMDCLICGLGWTETRMDYEADPEGMSIVERVDPLEVLADPRARKKNLVDARYLRRRRVYGREEYEDRWPNALFDPRGGGKSGEDVNRHSDNRRSAYQGENGPDEELGDEETYVDEYQWWESLQVVAAFNAATGEIEELTPEQAKLVFDQFTMRGEPPPPMQPVTRRVFWRAFRSGSQLLEAKEELPDGEFTLKAVTGKRDRNKGTWYGLVRSMVDPQKWSNTFFSQILHIIRSNAKGGVLIEDDAVDDIAEFEENWAASDAVQVLKPGALAAGKVRDKGQAPYPQGLDRLMQVAVQGVQDASGVNKEMLGLADRQQAGVLEFQRKQAAYGMLASFFDALRRYRRLQGRLLLKHITKYMSDGRLVRISGQDGVRYVQLVRQPETTRFDVIVDDAPSGPNQKERVWQIVQAMMPVLQGAGPEIWAELVNFSPLPTSLAQKIAQRLTQGQQADPQQQQLQQAQAQLGARQAAAKAARDEAGAAKTGAEARLIGMQADQEAAAAAALGLSAA